MIVRRKNMKNTVGDLLHFFDYRIGSVDTRNLQIPGRRQEDYVIEETQE